MEKRGVTGKDTGAGQVLFVHQNGDHTSVFTLGQCITPTLRTCAFFMTAAGALERFGVGRDKDVIWLGHSEECGLDGS